MEKVGLPTQTGEIGKAEDNLEFGGHSDGEPSRGIEM
jgi:hypothetical protein